MGKQKTMSEYRQLMKARNQTVLKRVIKHFKNICYDLYHCKVSDTLIVIRFHIREIRLKYHLFNILKSQFKIKHHSAVLIDDLDYKEFYDTSMKIAKDNNISNLNFDDVVKFYKMNKSNQLKNVEV